LPPRLRHATSSRFSKRRSRHRKFATLAISGGSTPKLLFARLAASGFSWDRVHLFWVDEAHGAATDPASNYKLAYDHLIGPAHIAPHQVHRIVGELPPEAAAEKYTQEIRDFFRLQKGELPKFDVVHRGIGPDAHTASLFPGEPLIDDLQGIASAVYAPQFKQWRVTLLPGVLLAARHTVFLVCGADKSGSRAPRSSTTSTTPKSTPPRSPRIRVAAWCGSWTAPRRHGWSDRNGACLLPRRP